MRRFQLRDGHEIRGFRIRLYPDKTALAALETLEVDLRKLWNWLVKQREDVREASAAYAVRYGLVGPPPVVPLYADLPPEEARHAKRAYIDAITAWRYQVHKATSELECCQYRKLKELILHFGVRHDYQLLSKVHKWYQTDSLEPHNPPGAHLLQALTKNFFTPSQRRKKFRRAKDPMPIQVRSGSTCFRMGDFGTRRGVPFYNCQIQIHGLKIRGRLPGQAPHGRVLEGVSLLKEADGWWASIKQEIPIRVPPTAEPGSVVGLDVGLDNLVAFSDGNRVPNSRGKAYAERIAGRQAQKLPVGRLHLAAARHARHEIYNKVIKPLARVETIKVERLPARIGQMGSKKTSAMRTIVSILKERYGERVREVPCEYTSQDCSQCGFRSKNSWSYEHGRIGKCPQCGYEADRDVNAARNIAAKVPIPLPSQQGGSNKRGAAR